MHELGITRNIVAIVAEQAQQREVVRVQIKIGKLSAIMPEAIRFCFDSCSKNTSLEHARLEILEVAGALRCEQCGSEFSSETLFGQCECGSRELNCIAGKELLITEMELA
ncbi:MAG: hydrogenase maturation nickel metallochaperone HypA [Spongiibacteraceae bacterium]